MQKVNSAKFRTSYVVLTEPTEVYAGRRKLGTWYPAGIEPENASEPPTEAPTKPQEAPTSAPKPAPRARKSGQEAQSERDAWLRRLSGA
jgi:hypothetical protein